MAHATRRALMSIGVAAAAVTAQAAQQTSGAADSTLPVTFAEHIAPIVYARCAPCHRPGGTGPFSLLTYDEVRRRATSIAAATRTRYMPPWKPDAPPGTFVGERRLAEQEVDAFQQWAAHGTPEGNRDRLPPMPQWTSGWRLGDPDLVIPLPEYTLKADERDGFRNFVMPIPGAGVRYVRGLEFRAASPAIHHANIRIDYTAASRVQDHSDPAPGYEGIIVQSAHYPDGHFLGWTPGQLAPLSPGGLAWALQPGGDFVVQLHMRPTGRPESIVATLGLFFTDDVPRQVPAMLRLGRQNIDVAPGDDSYSSADEYVVPVDIQVHAVQPHSHYRARQVRAWAELPDGRTQTLISIPQWDFNWQDVYRLAVPFWLPAGTRIRTEYLLDNSIGNPRNPETPPVRARWGFRSSDEMGDVWIQVMTRSEGERLRLVGDFRRKATAESAVGYEMQIAVDPDNAALHDDVALLYLELDKHDAAAAHFDATVRLRPRSPAALHNLATAREAAGRTADAISLYQAAIELDATYAPARVNLGNVRLLQGQIADAIGLYEEAIRVQPDNADAHNNLGRIFLAQERRADGIAHLEKAVRLQPAHVAAHFNLAVALLQGADAAGAVTHFREAARLRPAWPSALIALSWVLSSHPSPAIRQPLDAIELASRARDLSPAGDAAALDALAAAYASAGRFDEAESAAGRAAEIAAESGAREQLAQIERRRSLYRQRRPYVEPGS